MYIEAVSRVFFMSLRGLKGALQQHGYCFIQQKKLPFREAFLNKIYHLTTTATGLRKAVKNIECYRY